MVNISTRMNIQNPFVARLCIHHWYCFTKALFPWQQRIHLEYCRVGLGAGESIKVARPFGLEGLEPSIHGLIHLMEQ